MISQIRYVIGILCLHLFTSNNTTALHSFPDGRKLEKNETHINRCQDWQFQCDNGQCIAKQSVCDGLQNCKDHSDETYDQCRNKTSIKCTEEQFQCQYGACIEKKYQCDGQTHCIDGSDESLDTCNVLRDQTNAKRIKRNAETSCATPASSPDKTIHYMCNNNSASETCGQVNGSVPEWTIAIVTCKPGYHRDNSEIDPAHFCYNSQWLPTMNKCVKICDKLSPANVILQCNRYGMDISNCDGNSVLLVGTKVRSTCKPAYKYDSPSSYQEITCDDNGKWDNDLISCVPECGKSQNTELTLSGRITHGDPESVGGSPWNAAIFNKEKKLICSGTIISETMILTAAHCFSSDRSKCEMPDVATTYKDFEVIIGKYTNNYTAVDNNYQTKMNISKIYLPRKAFRGWCTHYASDIAIIIVKEKIPISAHILPACMNWENLKNKKYPSEGELGKVVGWGRTENGTLSPVLRNTTLPYISYHRCLDIAHEDFRPFITLDKFCAGSGSRAGSALLEGDSGGGLLFKEDDLFYLRGIVSIKPKSSVALTAFTDLYEYDKWIISVRDEIERNASKPDIGPIDIGNSSTVPKIYDTVNGVNFESVLRLGNSTEDMEKKIKIYETLYKVIRTNGLNDSQELHKLEQTITTEVLDGANGATYKEAELLLNRIRYNDILSYLQAGDFMSAEKKLIICTDNVYQFVVNEIYGQQVGDNFDLVLNFTESVQDDDQKLKLYKALLYTMRISGRKNHQKITQIIRSIEIYILDHSNETMVRYDAHLLLKRLYYEDIVVQLQSNDFAIAEQKLINITDEGYTYIVQEMYDQHNVSSNLELLLRFAESVRDDSQKLKLYLALYDKVRTSSPNDTQKLIQLSQSIEKNLPIQTGRTAREVEFLLDQISNDEIIGHLQSGEFSVAERLLNMRKDDDAYVSVMKQIYVYKQGADNFDLMKRFGESMQDATGQLKLFEALYDVMKYNGLNDTQTLLELGQSIRTSVLDRATGSTLIAARLLLNHVYYDNIIDNIISGDFALAEEKLINCTDDVYQFVVKEICNLTSIEPRTGVDDMQIKSNTIELLLNFAKYVKDVNQKLKLYDALHHETRTRNHSDDHIFIQLNQNIKHEILDQIKWETAIAAQSLFNRINEEHIIADLQARNFAVLQKKLPIVQKKLLTRTDDADNVSASLVRQFIDQQPDNFESLLKFADTTESTQEKFKLYNVLYDATNSSHNNREKLFRLYSSVKEQLNVSSDNSSKSHAHELMMKIVDKFAEPVSSNFINGSLQQLFDNASSVDVHILYGIYKKAIEMIWNKVTIPNALRAANHSLDHLIERMAVHEAITNKLESTGNLKTTSSLELGWHMKQIIDDSAYNEDVPQEWRSRYEDLKNKLPSSVRNLVFSSKVCIENKFNNEYLYAEGKSANSSSHVFPRVLTAQVTNKTREYKWIVVKSGNEKWFRFRNDQLNGYLTVKAIFSRDGSMQSVLTDGSDSSSSNQWNLEVDENGVCIKNILYNGYLFADAKEKSVFVHRCKSYKTLYSENWKIVDCS